MNEIMVECKGHCGRKVPRRVGLSWCPKCELEIRPAYDAYCLWWREITLQGDPIRRPNLACEGFIAGFKAGEKRSVPR